MANTRRYREYDLAHLKLVFEFSIYKVWKSVQYGVSKYWIWRIEDFLEHGYAVSSLMDTTMFLEEYYEVEKYVGRLPDMIQGSVMASKPKIMQDAIEFETELMDQKIHTFTDRQAKKKEA
ncbi:hypothetical protein Tco_0018837 [Tanacetum coccineum]